MLYFSQDRRQNKPDSNHVTTLNTALPFPTVCTLFVHSCTDCTHLDHFLSTLTIHLHTLQSDTSNGHGCVECRKAKKPDMFD